MLPGGVRRVVVCSENLDSGIVVMEAGSNATKRIHCANTEALISLKRHKLTGGVEW